jgi:folate-binding protein YgfZ
MSFKTNLADSSFFPALSGFSVLGIDGLEAESFLQSQTMNDVRTLATGRWQWNGWLNPKGRLISLFALARTADDSFLAILPDFPAGELLPMLQRFVFRSKVRLRVRDDLVCAAETVDEMTEAQATDAIDGSLETGFRLDVSGAGGHRYMWLLPAASRALAAPDAEKDAAWLLQDLRHGLPRLPVSQRESWTPQMLSLERLNAFSLKKGCYPGQEIVARTHYLGQSKRALLCLQGKGLTTAASVAGSDGRTTGTIIAATAAGDTALAVCSRDRDDDVLQVAEQPVNALPLWPGLARPLVTGVTPTGSQKLETGA